jgi:uncharacterized membrane protein
MIEKGVVIMKYPLIILVYFLLSACAGTQPIIYPNQHSTSVDQTVVRQDIAECKVMAERAGASGNSKAGDVAAKTAKSGAVGAASGAVGGAIAGSVGKGAAIGAASAATAGLIHGLFSDSKLSPAYQNFVTRCLVDKGYEVSGWD